MVTETMEAALHDDLQPARDSFADEIESIEAAALRTVAARLVRQQLQESAGRRDLWDAFYAWEAARQEVRRKRRAEEAAWRKSQQKTRPRKTSKKKTVASKSQIPDPPKPKSAAEFMKARR